MTPPPTNIDGTDISGATIDGQEVQEITIDGQTVFSAGPKLVDDFEDQNISEYFGDTGDFQVTDGNVDNITSPRNGSFMLREFISGGNSNIFSNFGLPNYPSRGDTFRVFVYFESGTGFQSSAETIKVFYGLQNSSNHYRVVISPLGDFIQFQKNGNAEAQGNGTVDGDQWYELEVQWGDTHTIKLRDLNGTVQASVSEFDTTYTSGGIGFGHNAGGSFGFWDHFRIL
jgi:hypothetical protein